MTLGGASCLTGLGDLLNLATGGGSEEEELEDDVALLRPLGDLLREGCALLRSFGDLLLEDEELDGVERLRLLRLRPLDLERDFLYLKTNN